jgi:hypothetical protein
MIARRYGLTGDTFPTGPMPFQRLGTKKSLGKLARQGSLPYTFHPLKQIRMGYRIVDKRRLQMLFYLVVPNDRGKYILCVALLAIHQKASFFTVSEIL